MLTRGMTAPLDIRLLPGQGVPGATGRVGDRAADQCDSSKKPYRPAGCGSARAPGRDTAARLMPPTASELGQLRARHGDPHPARAEIDDQGGVILDTDDPAEAVLIVCYLVLLRELLGRRSGGRGAERTCGQEAPGGGVGGFHYDQYAPLTLAITVAR